MRTAALLVGTTAARLQRRAGLRHRDTCLADQCDACPLHQHDDIRLVTSFAEAAGSPEQPTAKATR